MRVAFATDRTRAALTPDDRLAVDALRARGIPVVPLVWGEPTPPDIAGVVVRSTWDYHLDLPAFGRWLDALDRAGTRVWNPTDLLRWNADKSYLPRLGEQGVAIIPTVRVGAGAPIAPILDARGWDEVVVKPEVSAGGRATFRATRAQLPGVEATLLGEGGMFHVQPFLASVATEGEWSLLYFDGVYSHAVRKRPRPGGFLIHVEHGGNTVPGDPPEAARAAAARVLAAVGADTLYARVDLLRDGDAWLLIEVELIEPALFLAQAPGAADTFAAAVARRVEA